MTCYVICKPTVDAEAGFVRVGGAEVVGDDALVFPLLLEGDVSEVKDSGVFHHATVAGAHMGEVLHLSLTKRLLVLAPREGHGGAAAAGRRAGQTHILAQHRCCLHRVNRDLGLGQIVYRKCTWSMRAQQTGTSSYVTGDFSVPNIIKPRNTRGGYAHFSSVSLRS